MKQYLLALVLSLFCCQLVYAQSETLIEEVETNAFGYPDTSLVKIIDAGEKVASVETKEKPACDNKNLVKQAQEALRPYLDIDVYTIADKRKIRLVLKNVDNFTLLNSEDVNKQKNRMLAAKMVELKINNALDDANIKICQSDNPILGNKLYLMMYDFAGEIKVDILNFSDKQTPSFIFQQN